MKSNQKNFLIILTIFIIVLSVSSITSHAYASLSPQLHQGTPKEPNLDMVTHHYEYLDMIKSMQGQLKTPIHMDLFSIAHKNDHV